ncbi:helix-turn-helix domain-containing protein, partial [Oscillibacter valericigenes]|nr:helix-turn-helix domain-containing protein [Oscillibacter valericigenes]
MNNNYENLPAVLNANQLAAALGISRAGAYQLLNTGTFPTLRIGKRLLVPKDKLIDWIEQKRRAKQAEGAAHKQGKRESKELRASQG